MRKTACAALAALVLLVSASRAGTAPDRAAIERAIARQDYAAAERSATRALAAMRPGATDRGVFLGLHAYALIRQGRAAEGERDLKEALDTSPDRDVRAAVFEMAHQAYYAAGESYMGRHRYDLAIASFTALLPYEPDGMSMYDERAHAYLMARDFDRAIEDYTRYLDEGSDDSETRISRGGAYETKLDFAHAIADYSAAIAMTPRNDTALGFRGRAYAVTANYAAAARDLERAIALNHGDTPSLMWLHLVHLRTASADGEWLKRQAQGRDLKRWPGPALSYFLGRMPAEALVRFALTDKDTAQAEQRCDAWFYLGQEALAHGDRENARGLFRKTVTGCDALDFEWAPAQIELRRLARKG